MAAAQGQDQLREKNPLSSAQIASVNLFQIRYIISAITNPLTSVPSASSTSPSAARKGPTPPFAETGGICDVKRDSGAPSLSWPCSILMLSSEKKNEESEKLYFHVQLVRVTQERLIPEIFPVTTATS